MLRERRRHANFKPNRKLDRKSSRGMIYENEELRLRTININAEVERGQSDIKKLLKENYRLRTENWTLRDEYDRLDKLVKTKNQPNGQSARVSCDSREYYGDYCKSGYDFDDSYRCYNCLVDDDNISCDICNENEHCMKEFDERPSIASVNGDKECGTNKVKKSNQTSMPAPVRNDKINMNFDHLSVVSEECLSNSEDQTNQSIKDERQVSELTAEHIYNNFQSTIPPLKHFENLSYRDIGPNIDSFGEIEFDGEMHQDNEPTPPPPTPPPSTSANRRSTSLPLPPPPLLTEEGDIVQNDSSENESKNADSTQKYFFAPLKSRRKGSICPELRPDVLLVNNVLPLDGNRLATIRKPHNPLKYPSNLNAASIDPEATNETDGVQCLSKSIENMQMQSNRIYENVTTAKHTDADQSPPYRTEMSLVLSYSGNKSKYSTQQIAANVQEPVIHTPPPSLPRAMKLFPNKLAYAGKSDSFKSGIPVDVEQKIVNTDNSANEEMQSKTQMGSVIERSESDASNKKPSARNNEQMTKNGDNREPKKIDTGNSLSDDKQKETNSTKIKRDSNESQESKDAASSSNNSNEKESRRVSIHCNGIPMTDQPDNEPHSNDSDINHTNELSEEELMAMMPMSLLRSRRSSCRKVSEEFGSFLYPPNPFGFGAYKARGRRPSFLSRRHSDGLVPPRHNQYHLDYGLTPKTPSRCHCHPRGHANHHLGPDYNVDLCNNMSGSTASSICNNNLASSRESLGNISQQSSRRKMSITSHSKSGGKIPWCACWGNGCI